MTTDSSACFLKGNSESELSVASTAVKSIRVSKAGSSYRVTEIPVEAIRQVPVGIITPAML